MKSLYRKSTDAAERYLRPEAKDAKGDNALKRAFYTAKFEFYRAGWIIGYQAGEKAAKRALRRRAVP